MASRSVDQQEFDRRILEEYPHFLSVAYGRLLRAEGWREKVKEVMRLYELGARLLVLAVVGQYLLRDLEQVKNEHLNRMLEKEFFQRTHLGVWQEILFAAMDAYRGGRGLFFVPELYDLFWDYREDPPRGREAVREHLQALLKAWNEYLQLKERQPENEEGWRQLYEAAAGHLEAVLVGFSFLERYDLIRAMETEWRRGDTSMSGTGGWRSGRGRRS